MKQHFSLWYRCGLDYNSQSNEAQTYHAQHMFDRIASPINPSIATDTSGETRTNAILVIELVIERDNKSDRCV